MESFRSTTTIRGPVPRIRYIDIKNETLGERYELSVVFCGDRLARSINARYRNKTYSPNVLSFPLSNTSGEIFLNIRCAEREAQRMGVSLRARVALLFAHGCLHLKGMDHSDAMERTETSLMKRFQ